MSDNILAWASKLPLSAAIFVGSYANSKTNMLYGFGSFCFVLGVTFFFQISSMLSLFFQDERGYQQLAAVLLSLLMTPTMLVYMLHKNSILHKLNTVMSHLYEDGHTRLFTSINSWLPMTLDTRWRRDESNWGRKGFGDADSGARLLRRSSRSFLTDEIRDLGDQISVSPLSLFYYYMSLSHYL